MRASLILRCPAIGSCLPMRARTLDKFVDIVDMETTLELTKMFNLIPGMLCVALDGVTMNKQCKTLYTVSTGERSMLWTWKYIGGHYTLLCFLF